MRNSTLPAPHRTAPRSSKHGRVLQGAAARRQRPPPPRPKDWASSPATGRRRDDGQGGESCDGSGGGRESRAPGPPPHGGAPRQGRRRSLVRTLHGPSCRGDGARVVSTTSILRMTYIKTQMFPSTLVHASSTAADSPTSRPPPAAALVGIGNSPRAPTAWMEVTRGGYCLPGCAPSRQWLTLVHFSAQLERFVWDRVCAQGLCSPCKGGCRGCSGCFRVLFCVRHGSS